MPSLSRFERHIDIPEVGIEGQEKLFQSSVLIVGVGGLGCPSALYLAAAGVGSISLIDADTVDLSNLQRQILYTEDDVGKHKVAAAKKMLGGIASPCKVNTYLENLDQKNVQEIVSKHDIVLDCTDNFETRFLLNRSCYSLKKPLVSASLYHHDGQISVFKAYLGDDHPCYECVYPVTSDIGMAPNCKESGIMGPVAGILGTMQASATINELLGIGDSLSGWMLMFNALGFTSLKIRLKKKSNCQCCSPYSVEVQKPKILSCNVTEKVI